jgi:hypothetical protein
VYKKNKMNNISFFKALLMKEIDEELKGGQKKLDVAPPFGKINKDDFAKLRAKKGVKKEINTPNPPTDYSGKPSIPGLGPIVDMEEGEGQDHEVSMAQNSLKSIISSASQLMNMLGQDEKDVPAWIQDHITNAENYINQASKNYHEYNEGNTGEYDMDELPDGTIEKPAGDTEDLDMTLKSMMETKFISIKDFLSVLNQFPENASKEKVITAYNKLDAADQPEALKLASGKDVLPTPKKTNETSLKSIMESVVKRKKAK